MANSDSTTEPNALKRIALHMREQPFVTATGLAALVHSTWSLGTLFSGAQPIVSAPLSADGALLNGMWVAESAALLFWLLPALAISFALDIGQIVTSHDLRSGNRNKRKIATFIVFSVATYYLQWLYMAHHTPNLVLSDALNEGVLPFAQGVRDAAVWIVPALLPLSTLLYTLSYSEGDNASAPPAVVHVYEEFSVHVAPDDRARIPSESVRQLPQARTPLVETHARSGTSGGERTGETDGQVRENDDGTHTATCPYCATEFNKPTYAGAVNALSAHIGRWCKSKPTALDAVRVETGAQS